MSTEHTAAGSSQGKHSPGPFLAKKGHDGDPDRWVIVSGGEIPWVIAVIENGQPGDCCETEGHTANLFASSPDLLEAAESLVTAFTRNAPTDWTTAISKARAAIAKARWGAL